uniref:UBC core domain-containing protein n=1 Tax=Aplanochytrium stocchinoi TaxID=215587 RepID=A0A7S3PQ30_9STRA|mmetsp:Transcript_520/g.634  ORF Transcript_520/g.634 Transcript_520/m.634 type:complete len:698 (+) Transcript_520:150-2243(+)|eukprot:CAMPEP_0204828336 /NCGR_PEP_ID=MMETSP1346-20131115/6037_1 /ASSEMBLY_ACC=CAM_ASM_000771 /TAXON_ID=215587 /ORGANISM="Aplanochytrium stocchinoi, Strain GSBS06" /LENGTH=697 /DNA_ID=CAMNT_0051957317 /DNA_START=131 /DNA_END=2224 /DNA_ORIENTATION=-
MTSLRTENQAEVDYESEYEYSDESESDLNEENEDQSKAATGEGSGTNVKKNETVLTKGKGLKRSYEYDTSDYVARARYHRMLNRFPDNRIWVKQVLAWEQKFNFDNLILMEFRDKNPLSVFFTIFDKESNIRARFSLSVPASLKEIEINKFEIDNSNGTCQCGEVSIAKAEPERFPQVPPTMEYFGPRTLPFKKVIQLMYWTELRVENWNVCSSVDSILADIREFVLTAKPREPEDRDFNEYESLLLRLSELTGIFPTVTSSSSLPRFGVQQPKSSKKVRRRHAGIGYSSTRGTQMTWEQDTRRQDEIVEILRKLWEKREQIDNALLADSCLVAYVTQSLKNTSLMEIQSRMSAYFDLFAWALFICKIPDSKQHVRESVEGLITQLSRWKGEFENLMRLSGVEHERFKQAVKDFDAVLVLHDNTKIKEDSSPLKNSDHVADYKSQLDDVHVTTLTDFVNLDSKRKMKKLSGKQTIRIAQEFMLMKKSLPLGESGAVFLRWCEKDISRMKAMIVPSTSTPYGGGCFHFDIELPSTYPQTPPKVLFLTTGGGTHRFNPNLYANGKVCLSLLGTWTGEQWDPNVSNLYQVLMSIYALIFVDEPYFNEPGYQNMYGKPRAMEKAREYIKTQRRATVQYAMIDALKSPPEEFQNAVRKHFQARCSEIFDLLRRWAAEDPKIEQKLSDFQDVLAKEDIISEDK